MVKYFCKISEFRAFCGVPSKTFFFFGLRQISNHQSSSTADDDDIIPENGFALMKQALVPIRRIHYPTERKVGAGKKRCGRRRRRRCLPSH